MRSYLINQSEDLVPAIIRKSSIINLCAFVLIGLLACNMVYRHWAMNSFSLPGFLAMFFLAFTPLFTFTKKAARNAGIYVATIGAALVPWAVVNEGGLVSIPVLWFPVIPLIAVFFIDIKWGALFLAVTLLEILTVGWLQLSGGIELSGNVITVYEQGRVYYAMSALMAISIFSYLMASLTSYYERQAFKQLKASSAHFEAIANHAKTMVWSINEWGRVDYLNPALKRFLAGRSLSDLSSLLVPDQYTGTVFRIMRAWQRKKFFKLKAHGLDCEGTRRILEVIAIPKWYASGQFRGYTGLIVDHTLEHEREVKLQEAQTLVQQLRVEKSRFIAELAHEVRTPIGVIVGYAELLRYDRPKAKLTEYLEAIHQSSEYILKLLNDLLDYAKIDTHKIEPNPQRVDLDQLMNDILASFKYKAQAKSVKLHFVRDCDVPRFIVMDALRLKQIIMNLVSNAVKFTDHGEVKIEVRMQQTHNGPQIQFFVRDTGIGIAPENIRKLFVPFSQASAETVIQYGGTGLGLALSKQMACALGGDLVLEDSNRNKGSCFLLQLPLCSSEQEYQDFIKERSLQKVASKKDLLKGKTILLADPVMATRMFILRLLQEHGATVIEAVDSVEFVEKARSHQFDLIIMAYKLPGGGVLKTIEKLRNFDAKTPVVLLKLSYIHQRLLGKLTNLVQDIQPKTLGHDDLLAMIVKWTTSYRQGL